VGGGVGRFEDVRFQVSRVRCHVSQRKSCVKLRTQYSGSNASKLKMLLLRKVILQKFKFKVLASARRD
jgi:hypothetical protein